MRTAETVRKQRIKRVTLADVAARAGVSVATASVAITGRPSGNCRVSPAVAEKIRAAARELSYRPNLQARNLSTQRTHTAAMLIKRASWHNAMFYVGAAQKVLRSHGYAESFLLHDNVAKDELEHLELCLQRGVEGIISIPLIDPQGQANVEMYNRLHTLEKIPVVQLGIALPGCVAPSVTADIGRGVAKSVTLLHAMGHRRIAMSTVPGYDDPAPLNPNIFAHLVYQGYREGMASLGLAEQIFCSAPPENESIEQFDVAIPLGAEIARATERPTAVIAFSSYAAAGLIAGLGDQGLRVPEHVSVIACGEQAFARMMRPALATLTSPFEKMGALAAEMLLKLIEGGTVTSTAMAPSINFRDSVRELT